MSKASRRKRLWARIQQRPVVDPLGREGTILTTPKEWLDMDTGLPPGS